MTGIILQLRNPTEINVLSSAIQSVITAYHQQNQHDMANPYEQILTKLSASAYHDFKIYEGGAECVRFALKQFVPRNYREQQAQLQMLKDARSTRVFDEVYT